MWIVGALVLGMLVGAGLLYRGWLARKFTTAATNRGGTGSVPAWLLRADAMTAWMVGHHRSTATRIETGEPVPLAGYSSLRAFAAIPFVPLTALVAFVLGRQLIPNVSGDLLSLAVALTVFAAVVVAGTTVIGKRRPTLSSVAVSGTLMAGASAAVLVWAVLELPNTFAGVAHGGLDGWARTLVRAPIILCVVLMVLVETYAIRNQWLSTVSEP